MAMVTVTILSSMNKVVFLIKMQNRHPPLSFGWNENQYLVRIENVVYCEVFCCGSQMLLTLIKMPEVGNLLLLKLQ